MSCDFCNSMTTKHTDSMSLDVRDGNRLRARRFQGEALTNSANFYINYCPMCGSKLEGGRRR